MSDIYPLWNFHRTIADIILREWLNKDGERAISHVTLVISLILPEFFLSFFNGMVLIITLGLLSCCGLTEL